MILGMSYQAWEDFIADNYESFLNLPNLCFNEFFIENYLAENYEFSNLDVDILDFLREGLDLYEISPWYDSDTNYRLYGIKVYSTEGIIGVQLSKLNADFVEAEKNLRELLQPILFDKLEKTGNLEVLFGADVS